MTNEQILNYINQNKIDELKQLVLEEIGRETNKKVPTYKAIQRLSKQVYRDMYKTIPMLAGAYYLKDYTIMCNGYWLAMFNGEISGLQMVCGIRDYFDAFQAYKEPDNTYSKVKVDIDEVKNTIKIDKKDATITIANSKFNANYIAQMFDCLEDCEFLIDKNANNKPIYLIGKNGKGLILPRDFKKNSVAYKTAISEIEDKELFNEFGDLIKEI